MLMIDFIYDKIRASEMGLTIGSFDYVTDETWNIGNKINPNPTKAIQSDHYWSIGPEYNQGQSPYETDFSVCRDPCTIVDDDGSLEKYAFSEFEIERIVSWLNRKTYHRFEAVYEDHDYDTCFYMATFNVELIKVGEYVVGFQLHMMTNAPYAWGNREQFKGVIDPDHPMTIKTRSHDSGFQYIEARITPLESGHLEITNEADPGYVTVIENAVAGNTYYMPEHIKQLYLEGNGEHPWLFDDYNWCPIRFVNQFRNHKNIFHSTLPISINWTYCPIRKVGFVG